MQQDVTAVVARGFECGLDEVHESDVDHGQLQLDVSKVTGRVLVLTVVGWTEQTGFDDTHVRVHQTLLVGVSVILVGVSRFDFHC